MFRFQSGSASRAFHCWAFTAITAFAGSVAQAGGDWVEVGDAPDGVPASQTTVGVLQPSIRIVGNINRPAGDHVDTFAIRVTNPTEFLATVDPGVLPNASSDFDARLYLWEQDGTPLLGNDQTSSGDATLGDPNAFANFPLGDVSAEAAGVVLEQDEIYLLSITTTGNDPLDAGGPTPVIDLAADPDALQGANAAAGSFDGWQNAADSTIGDYAIFLVGATFAVEIPEPAAVVLAGAFGIGVFLVRQRHSAPSNR